MSLTISIQSNIALQLERKFFQINLGLGVIYDQTKHHVLTGSVSVLVDGGGEGNIALGDATEEGDLCLLVGVAGHELLLKGLADEDLLIVAQVGFEKPRDLDFRPNLIVNSSLGPRGASIIQAKGSRQALLQGELEGKGKGTSDKRRSHRKQHILPLKKSIRLVRIPRLRLHSRSPRVLPSRRRHVPSHSICELGLLIPANFHVDGIDVQSVSDGEHDLAADGFTGVVLLLFGVDEDLVGGAQGLKDDHGVRGSRFWGTPDTRSSHASFLILANDRLETRLIN